MQSIDEALGRLEKSKFRSSFHLDGRDMEYVRTKGLPTIESHARDFVRQKLSAADPENDGRQTPMRGHPVFKAMHATATCCRGCLNKWYRVPLHRELTEDQQEKIVRLQTAWISRQMNTERNDL